MPTTSNFGWTTPADTDLVKDGAAAIRTLGNGIDTSFLDLKGGTTGQVLSKASNTDLDFSWIAQDDADAIQKSLIDAEGDLIVGDAADAVQRLAIGSNGNVLTVDTAVDGKIKWAAPAGGGKVLQVVSATHTGQASSSSTTFADTGLTVNITPSSATSKVLIMATSIVGKTNGNATSAVHTRIVRGSTGVSEHQLYNYTNTALELTSTFSQVYLDSPNTTSSTTYKIQFKNASAVAEVYFGWNSTNSQIIVMEIGA
jgi:hypothetical protein